jgi:hypothetical protein
MCSPVRCQICGNITWSGCGDHIDSVKAMVPDDLWCPGHEPGHEPSHERSHEPGHESNDEDAAPTRGPVSRLFR